MGGEGSPKTVSVLIGTINYCKSGSFCYEEIPDFSGPFVPRFRVAGCAGPSECAMVSARARRKLDKHAVLPKKELRSLTNPHF